MQNTTVRIAFATDKAGLLHAGFFGSADTYQLFEWKNQQFSAPELLPNPTPYGSSQIDLMEKGQAIVDLLNQRKINLLVSGSFGENIRLMTPHFIPVIIHAENIDAALLAIERQMHWIVEELKQDHTHFKVFTIGKGIIKSKVDSYGFRSKNINA